MVGDHLSFAQVCEALSWDEEAAQKQCKWRLAMHEKGELYKGVKPYAIFNDVQQRHKFWFVERFVGPTNSLKRCFRKPRPSR